MSTAPAEATGTPTEPPAATPPATPPTGTPATPPAPPVESNVWDDPAKAKAEIERLRRENGDARITAKQQAAQEARDELLTKLGLKDGDKPVDAEELARQLAAKDTDLSAKDQKIRALTVENALSKAARKTGADEDLLVPVLAHKGTLDDLDPSDPEFTTKLDALVKAEMDANPKLKLVRAASASGSDFAGGSGEGALTQEKFNSMSPAEKNTLYKTDPTAYRKFSGR